MKANTATLALEGRSSMIGKMQIYEEHLASPATLGGHGQLRDPRENRLDVDLLRPAEGPSAPGQLEVRFDGGE